MGAGSAALTGPDLAAEGVPVDCVIEGQPLLGHANGEPVLLLRAGEELFAVSATCPHYGAPLAEGLQVGATLRCPWHHAAFDLRSGAVLRPPALNGLGCYALERDAGRVRVLGRKPAQRPVPAPGPTPESVVIIGAGAAGHAAAETLRREGCAGRVVLVGADESPPYDRPNLSKDYLAGSAPEEWIPLRSGEDYAKAGIELRVGVRATALDTAARTVSLSDGTQLGYGALLLATGADPVQLDIPGARLPHVHTLRTLADCRAIIARAARARRAVLLGAGFIGLEVAAALRTRGLEVDVVAPGTEPLERVVGAEVGAFLRALHESHGVRFHMGKRAVAIDRGGVTLSGGEALPAELVVVGVGVRPSLALAESAGLALDRGVKVDAQLRTSAPGVWAAGDIARWPDPHTGRALRVEHWVVAQRQGQAAARNILGRGEPFEAVPFFWTQQYDLALSCVGSPEGFERTERLGSLEARDCTVRFVQGARTLAVLTVGRDAEGLRAELALESTPPAAVPMTSPRTPGALR
ncbi:Rieske 2Fe-2S domain-containing protein [Aggregicoccus sp. 17bor-14]|uniref:FAD-dependent oxidoreductase n=1 Tax=Myxococcaceae TaxID=31 RepID=UPI00129CC8A9|nr:MULTISPECIES: FAD-dependent oxidoreductase [Myxococcaceae]MBF5041913.1 FAD-dependent oxidoreductase [Simulacricoccus sp. 17bor-14]MRI87694.1 Rieske 2Fe-2S domain-containing protein [Aggregicoccus sp. 17bor-14]